MIGDVDVSTLQTRMVEGLQEAGGFLILEEGKQMQGRKVAA